MDLPDERTAASRGGCPSAADDRGKGSQLLSALRYSAPGACGKTRVVPLVPVGQPVRPMVHVNVPMRQCTGCEMARLAAGRGLVQADCSSNEGCKSLLIDFIVLVDVNGASEVAFEA